MPRPIDKFPGDWSRPLSVDRPVADRIEAGRASQARREAREAMERWESSPVADREPLSAEEERDLREWVANVEPKSTPTEIARLLATLDAARAHPDDEAWQWVAEHYPKVMVEMPTDLFRKLDAARAHPDEAGLREAYRRYAESAEGAGSVHSPVVQRLVEAVFDHIEAALAQPAVPVAGAEEGRLRAALIRLIDESIFDLPIGNDVTYSRGYSAGISAAKDALREQAAALAVTQPERRDGA